MITQVSAHGITIRTEVLGLDKEQEERDKFLIRGVSNMLGSLLTGAKEHGEEYRAIVGQVLIHMAEELEHLNDDLNGS